VILAYQVCFLLAGCAESMAAPFKVSKMFEIKNSSHLFYIII